MTLAELNQHILTAGNAANPKGMVRFGPLAEVGIQRNQLPLMVVAYPTIDSTLLMENLRDVYRFTVFVLVTDTPQNSLDSYDGANRPTRLQSIEQADALRVAFIMAFMQQVDDLVGLDSSGQATSVTLADAGTVSGYQFGVAVTINRRPGC